MEPLRESLEGPPAVAIEPAQSPDVSLPRQLRHVVLPCTPRERGSWTRYELPREHMPPGRTRIDRDHRRRPRGTQARHHLLCKDAPAHGQNRARLHPRAATGAMATAAAESTRARRAGPVQSCACPAPGTGNPPGQGRRRRSGRLGAPLTAHARRFKYRVRPSPHVRPGWPDVDVSKGGDSCPRDRCRPTHWQGGVRRWRPAFFHARPSPPRAGCTALSCPVSGPGYVPSIVSGDGGSGGHANCVSRRRRSTSTSRLSDFPGADLNLFRGWNHDHSA